MRSAGGPDGRGGPRSVPSRWPEVPPRPRRRSQEDPRARTSRLSLLPPPVAGDRPLGDRPGRSPRVEATRSAVRSPQRPAPRHRTRRRLTTSRRRRCPISPGTRRRSSSTRAGVNRPSHPSSDALVPRPGADAAAGRVGDLAVDAPHQVSADGTIAFATRRAVARWSRDARGDHGRGDGREGQGAAAARARGCARWLPVPGRAGPSQRGRRSAGRRGDPPRRLRLRRGHGPAARHGDRRRGGLDRRARAVGGGRSDAGLHHPGRHHDRHRRRASTTPCSSSPATGRALRRGLDPHDGDRRGHGHGRPSRRVRWLHRR